MKVCSVDGCGRPYRCKGMCNAHYLRWRKYGDPLKTLTAPVGEPLRYLCEVVLAYEGDECLTWPYSKSKGYGHIWLDGRMQVVSRMVCEEMNGPPPTPEHEAAHSCGKGHLACVTKRHLSWKTPKENIADQYTHGTRIHGEFGCLRRDSA